MLLWMNQRCMRVSEWTEHEYTRHGTRQTLAGPRSVEIDRGNVHLGFVMHSKGVLSSAPNESISVRPLAENHHR